MRIFCDTASLAEIKVWAEHPWVSGFTTNPTLFRQGGVSVADGKAWEWAKGVVHLAAGRPVSIDGPANVCLLGKNVYRKVASVPLEPVERIRQPINHTAICHAAQITHYGFYRDTDILSVFAGRIMDTGRDPQPVIDAAKATGAQVLWASVREPYNIVQAEQAGCDIVTVPPAILRKYLDWYGKPLEVVAEETIAQFDRDRDGLW